MSIFAEILGLGGGLGLTKGAYDRLGSVGDSARNFALGPAGSNPQLDQQGLAQYTSNMANFRPYGVTSGLGSANVAQDGSTTFNLSGQQQGLQNALTSGGMSLLNQAQGGLDPNIQRMLTNQRYNQTDPTAFTRTAENKKLAYQQGNAMLSGLGMGQGAREQEVYERIRGMQEPGEERERLAMENRLMGQGRLGVRTANYGGTPEQLAMAQAQSEAQNQASLMAMQQAQSEQMQQANIGTSLSQLGQQGATLQQSLASQNVNDILGMLGAGANQQQIQGNLGTAMVQGSYLPQSALLNQAQAGYNNAALADTARRQAAGAFGEAAMSGYETDLAARLGQANLMGNLGTGLLSGTLQTQINPVTGEVIGGLQGISNALPSWLGGNG